MVNGWLLLICPPKMVVNRLTKIGNSKGKTRGKSTCWCRPGMFLMVVKTLCFFETPHKLGYSCGHIPSYTYKLYGTTHPMMVLSHPTIAGESGICKTWGSVPNFRFWDFWEIRMLIISSSKASNLTLAHVDMAANRDVATKQERGMISCRTGLSFCESLESIWGTPKLHVDHICLLKKKTAKRKNIAMR